MVREEGCVKSGLMLVEECVLTDCPVTEAKSSEERWLRSDVRLDWKRLLYEDAALRAGGGATLGGECRISGEGGEESDKRSDTELSPSSEELSETITCAVTLGGNWRWRSEKE